MRMKKLNVEDLSVIYHGKHKHVRAVDRVSFSIDAGDSLGIIGEPARQIHNDQRLSAPAP